MDLYTERLTSPIGRIALVWESEVLRALDFDDHEERFQRSLRTHCGNFSLKPRRAPASIRHPIEAYFDGDIAAIETVPVKSNGTPFQELVWRALRGIPAGATMSYGELAERIGRKGASRAVGMANGANPVGIVVPCHRVIGANGALTGYGGGLDRKRWLLNHERNAILLTISRAHSC